MKRLWGHSLSGQCYGVRVCTQEQKKAFDESYSCYYMPEKLSACHFRHKGTWSGLNVGMLMVLPVEPLKVSS